ncbi:MAG: 2-C-methyl-D-erythritol 2,4-cyclodiphosphate synthase, partial [Clostridia bacterium]
MRIGQGYDVHKLVENRKLILGGVTIEFEKGLLGHSDADVLVHAICDALLGAAAERDIGFHFPDSDERYKGISSLLLLSKVDEILKNNNYQISNIDATIIAQKPKLSMFIPLMINNISTALNIDPKKINIKATTEEGLGFTGLGAGIAAQAVVLIYESAKNE